MAYQTLSNKCTHCKKSLGDVQPQQLSPTIDNKCKDCNDRFSRATQIKSNFLKNKNEVFWIDQDCVNLVQLGDWRDKVEFDTKVWVYYDEASAVVDDYGFADIEELVLISIEDMGLAVLAKECSGEDVYKFIINHLKNDGIVNEHGSINILRKEWEEFHRQL